MGCWTGRIPDHNPKPIILNPYPVALAPTMKSTYRIGTWAGISVFVHWTFIIMMGGFFVFFLMKGGSLVAALSAVALVAAAFGCVILHEYGHALMARRFNIPTLDITMYPIGGIARLKGMPEDPKQEFLIAIAGPLVNVAIAGVLYVINSAQGRAMDLDLVLGSQTTVLGLLMWMNIAMAAFNMLPAFPMDGGRVLRAGLASKIGYSRGTQIAGMVGMGMAVIFATVGILNFNFVLVFIAIFVFLGAKQEIQHVVGSA